MKMKITALILAALFFAGMAAAQDHAGILNNYVENGLNSNLALKQQQFSLDKSIQALKEARGMFLPSVSIEARYSRAGGGRTIEFPVGDLVNPIHHTLNRLLMAQGMPAGFPGNIPNEQIPFLRKEEHETKLRIAQPVFQPAIYHNLKIKKKLTEVEKERLNVFKRQLVTDIKAAYYTYLTTLEVEKLLTNTRELLEENLRVSESLFRNHKVTGEVVHRSKAELSKLDMQQTEARKNCRMAAAYFNFLLNRPTDTEIAVARVPQEPVFRDIDHDKLTLQALQYRGEFRQLKSAIAAAGHSHRLHKSSILPNVTAVFDYGFQGEKYRFTGDEDYWMGSLVLSWNLFKGGQDRAKAKQSMYQQKQLHVQQQELESQVRLQVKEACHDMEVAQKAVISAKDTLESSKAAFHIVAKKYSQGMAPQIEYTKARNDYTNAGITRIIAVFDYYIKEAQLERVSAAYAFN